MAGVDTDFAVRFAQYDFLERGRGKRCDSHIFLVGRDVDLLEKM